jgi:hypothetical protein
MREGRLYVAAVVRGSGRRLPPFLLVRRPWARLVVLGDGADRGVRILGLPTEPVSTRPRLDLALLELAVPDGTTSRPASAEWKRPNSSPRLSTPPRSQALQVGGSGDH